MKNWSGLEKWNPSEILLPRSEEAINKSSKLRWIKSEKFELLDQVILLQNFA